MKHLGIVVLGMACAITLLGIIGILCTPEPGKEAKMFQLTSPDFENGAKLPKEYTMDGEKTSPPLEWANAPGGAKSFALVMTDSDAPPEMWPGVFVHWIVYDIPARVNKISEGAPIPGRTLKNSYADFGMMDFAWVYGPPWPPTPDHRYTFTLYALKCEALPVDSGASYADFMKAILPETIAATTLVGIYGPAETPLPTG